jgi:hypothetical protein
MAACGSKVEHGCLLFDRLELIQLADPAAGADFAGVGPRFGRADIRVPERPGAALPRAGGVDAALAGFGVEEDAIVGLLQLFEAFSDTNFANVLFFKLGNIDADLGGKRGDLFGVHPDVAGRAGAAIAAAGALELQAVLVPGLIVLFSHPEDSIFGFNHEDTKARRGIIGRQAIARGV